MSIRGMGLALVLLIVAGCDGNGKSSTPSPPSTPPASAPTRWTPPAGLELPVITAKLPAVSHDATAVVVTPAAIVVDGEALVPLRDGAVDPAELEGGALGMKIPRVERYMATLGAIRAGKPGGNTVALFVDKRLSYRLLYQLIYSIKGAAKRFEIVALVGGEPVGIEIKLPEPAAGASAAGGLGDTIARVRERRPDGTWPDDPAQRLQLAVSIAGGEVRLWSISGLEGTLQAPKLVVPDDAAGPAAISAALAQIVAGRWPKGRSETDERQVILMADATTTMQSVAAYMTAIRHDATGVALFPDILLAAGFEQ